MIEKEEIFSENTNFLLENVRILNYPAKLDFYENAKVYPKTYAFYPSVITCLNLNMRNNFKIQHYVFLLLNYKKHVYIFTSESNYLLKNIY